MRGFAAAPPAPADETDLKKTTRRIKTMKAETIQTSKAILSAAISDPRERAEVLALLKPKTPARERMLTTKAACQFAGVCKQTLRRWERKGYLHPKHITPSRVRWPQSELEAFLCESATA